MSRALPAAPTLALALLIGLLPLAAQAQWKWRDGSGQINVSDRPPPKGTPERDILGRPVPEARRPLAAEAAASAASAPLSLARPAGDKELDARKRAAEQEQSAKAKADEERVAAQKAENCRRARSHLSALESGQRIARVNDKGEREILDDRARADEMRQSREVIGSDCR